MEKALSNFKSKGINLSNGYLINNINLDDIKLIKDQGYGVIQEILIDNFIIEVPLEDLAQMSVANAFKSVRYVENGGKKLLVNYTIGSTSKLLHSGLYLRKIFISNILYTEVEQYKKAIIYDHSKKITCTYTNEFTTIVNNSSPYILAVWRYPSKPIKLIGDAIIKHERLINKN